MKSLYFVFSGVSCCERLSSQEIEGVLANIKNVSKASSLMQADTLVVLGGISVKQSPLLKDMWQQLANPARCVHIVGCDKAIESPFVSRSLDGLIDTDAVLYSCQADVLEVRNVLMEKR